MLTWFYSKVKENIIDPTIMLDYKAFINEHKGIVVSVITIIITLIVITIINYVRVANYIELILVSLLIYGGYVSIGNFIEIVINKEDKGLIKEE